MITFTRTKFKRSRFFISLNEYGKKAYGKERLIVECLCDFRGLGASYTSHNVPPEYISEISQVDIFTEPCKRGMCVYMLGNNMTPMYKGFIVGFRSHKVSAYFDKLGREIHFPRENPEIVYEGIKYRLFHGIDGIYNTGLKNTKLITYGL